MRADLTKIASAELSEENRRLQRILRRQRYLPEQLEAARKKVVMLENEARRYGMEELL